MMMNSGGYGKYKLALKGEREPKRKRRVKEPCGWRFGKRFRTP
jgi:hypothetical protein